MGLQPDVRYVLSAQLAATPPDETPGLHHVRDLTEAEAAQFREDLELIRSVASIAPYARAVTAYRQLVELVEGLKPDAKGRPSARGAAQLRQALSAVSHAFRELPDQLADALAKRLGSEAPGAGRLDGAISGFKLEPACRLISALPTVPAHGFVLHGADARRDVLVDASSWAESTEMGVVAIVATVEAAVDSAGRLLSQYLLEQRELVDAASKRVAALDGEAFQGASAVIEMRPAPGGEELHMAGLTPLPITEIQALQHGLARARRLLEAPEREPAQRGVPGMTDEQARAILTDAHSVDLEEPPAASDDDDHEPDAEGRPLDLNAVIAHLQLGAARLEHAWAQAVSEETVQSLAGEWESLLRAMSGEFAHADRDLSDDEREIELPPSMATIACLDPSPDAADADAQARLAQVMALAELAQLIPTLSEPTVGLTDANGNRVAWFSSGAFASLRDHLELLAELTSPRDDTTAVSRSLRLAERATLRADPEAAIMHMARALRSVGDNHLPLPGTDNRAIIDRVLELAPRIAAGERVQSAAVALIAQAAHEIVRSSLP